MDVINQVLVLFFLMLIGFVGRRVAVITHDMVSQFTVFVLNFSLPALILVSLQKDFNPDLLGQAGITLALSFSVYALSFALAAIYPRLLGLSPQERGVHRYAVIFSNVGFMGYPVVAAVLGEGALFNLAIYNIPFNVLAFSIGAWLIAKEGHRPLSLSWKTFINPSVVATVIGFACFLATIRFPAPLFQTLKMTGDITSPLSMILVGAILADMDGRRIFGSWRYYVTVVLRLALIPLAVGIFLYVLGLRGLLFTLPVLVTAMPIAANTTSLASVYQGDTEGASAWVFMSTLLCVITIPFVAIFIKYGS